MILASTIALRWFSPAPWAGKSAVLLGLHVAAMALLSVGAIGVRRVSAVRVCALWALGGALLELLQHPFVVAFLLPLLAQNGPANFIALFLVNGVFTTQELVAAVLGGALGFVLILQITAVRASSVDGQASPPTC